MSKEGKRAINFMKDFAEGRVSTDCFWEEYKKNPLLQKILIKDKTRIRGVHKFDPQTGRLEFHKKKPLDSMFLFNPDNLLQSIDIGNPEHRVILFGMVQAYFVRRRKKLKYYNREEREYAYLEKAFPDWVRPDIFFLQSVMSLAPEGFSEEQKFEWSKKEIQRLFKFDEKPPEWIQEPQWPIVNGKPLIFNCQETDKNDIEHELYYFYNPETKEIVVISQYV